LLNTLAAGHLAALKLDRAAFCLDWRFSFGVGILGLFEAHNQALSKARAGARLELYPSFATF